MRPLLSRPNGLVLVLSAALLIACAQERAVSPEGADTMAFPPAPASIAESRARSASDMSGVAVKTLAATAPGQGRQAPVIQDSATAMLIRTGSVSVLVDSVDVAVARIRALAERLDGFVANTAMQSGPQQVRSATITLRIPAARFDEALGALQPLGEVETVHTGIEDVGEEFVDVRARVANARRLEERLVALLATRTGRLDDVLAVERELARVREEIERFEGRLRYLRSRVALSTLTVTAHESAPLIGDNPATNPIGRAFVTAWRNFVAFLAGVIAAAGWVLPAGAIALGVVALLRRLGWTWPARRPPRHDEAQDAAA